MLEQNLPQIPFLLPGASLCFNRIQSPSFTMNYSRPYGRCKAVPRPRSPCQNSRARQLELARAHRLAHCGIHEKAQNTKTVEKLMRNLNRGKEIQVSGGPFHYMMRAGTYGEIYDEPGWKVNLGIAEIKERSAVGRSPMACRYDPRVLCNDWVEERRDRLNIKYDNSPKLSEYGHIYKSEYGTSYSKPLCNKARDVLLKIPSFPITGFPGHQPELDVDVLLCSAPKPEGCILDEETAACRREIETEKRYERYAKEVGKM